jgi:recombinational DNA repair protein RecR
LQLLKKRDVLMVPLAEAIAQAAAAVKTCSTCGALDTTDPCHLCVAPERDDGVICVPFDMTEDIYADAAKRFAVETAQRDRVRNGTVDRNWVDDRLAAMPYSFEYIN